MSKKKKVRNPPDESIVGILKSFKGDPSKIFTGIGFIEDKKVPKKKKKG